MHGETLKFWSCFSTAHSLSRFS